MHARLDQLLSLRDGAPVDAEVRSHIQQCAICLAESARLAQTRERLQALPPLQPSRDFWPDIRARADVPPRRRAHAGIAATAAALAIGAIGYLALRDPPDSLPLPKIEEQPVVVVRDEIEDLMAQSRELEALLAYLPEPHVERVSTAAAVASIEQRIQLLDWQLAHDAEGELDQRQAQRLWSERVDLMDSLVKVRYAQSAPVAF